MKYWERRQRQLNKALEKDEAALNKRLAGYYAEEEARLQQQIAAYYTTYGDGNVIEYRKLLLDLPDADYRLLMTDMDRFAEKYPEYKHLLPIRASIYKLNRLEGLEMSVYMEQLRIGAMEQEEVEKHLEEIARRSYDSVIAKTGTVGEENADIIKVVVHSNWTGGGNFSERIWNNRIKLAQVLKTDIAAGFARGDNYQKITSNVRQRFRVSQKEAMRMVYTEGTFAMNEARAKAIENTFMYYSVCTVGDGKVCDRCRDAQDKTRAHPVKFSDRIAGVNFPPFHPWCRCTEQVVIADPQEWIEQYVAAHGGDPGITEGQRAKAMELLKEFAI